MYLICDEDFNPFFEGAFEGAFEGDFEAVYFDGAFEGAFEAFLLNKPPRTSCNFFNSLSSP